jgi:hypothetical protein
LTDEQEALEDLRDALADSQQQRLAQIESVLAELENDDIIYPQPMLASQVSYLYNMINTADQAPGREAEERYKVLAARLRALSASIDE